MKARRTRKEENPRPANASTSLQFDTTARMETLADGVFAIAMTLLILEIRVPAATGGALVHDVLRLWPNLLSYLISFFMLGIYWVAHHSQFHFVKRADRNLFWLNILFLMAISFLPFSAGLLGTHPMEQISAIVYALNLIVIGLSLRCLWGYATTRHRLVAPDLSPAFILRAKRIVLVQPISSALAICGSE